MTWTQTTLTIKDAAGTNQPVIAYTDGTNFSFAHPLLDNTGAIIGSGNPLSTQLPAPLIVSGTATTRPANTTGYSAGALLANSTTAGSVTYPTIAAARGTNVASTILRMRLQKSGTSITNAIFRVHLYNTLPSVTNGDGGTWLSTTAGYVGAFDVTMTQTFSDSSMGIGIPTAGSTVSFTPVSGTANLYYLIEVRAAYTPVSGEVFTPYGEVQ